MRTTLTLEQHEREVWAGSYADAVTMCFPEPECIAIADTLILDCRRIAVERWGKAGPALLARVRAETKKTN